MEEKLHSIFKSLGLNITTQINTKATDFLDICLVPKNRKNFAF